MKITQTKKLVQIGGAVGLVLPKWWLDNYNLNKHSKITLVIDETIILKPGDKDKNEK